MTSQPLTRASFDSDQATKWEYAQLTRQLSSETTPSVFFREPLSPTGDEDVAGDVHDALAAIGAAGWELVAVDTLNHADGVSETVYTFKRVVRAGATRTTLPVA